MLKCIKTGFTLYVESENKHTNVDLFFDGRDLYVNKNRYFDGVPSYQIEGKCTILEVGDTYDKLMYPELDQSVIAYVSNMKYKSRIEDAFIEMFQ